ncbi:MAG TPA: xanthine dehydrogenase family protein molybdopterin-binding subunit [Methylomirabilota bacterium]|nr:xanthine dehydrogenase family protein molybdopterin-binding subunit [Methylomirabilota bacterium]
MASPFGAPLKRKEDHRFVAGAGRYVDDIRLPGMLHAAFVRSPHAHARVDRIDPAPAQAMPGVAAAFTAADLPECAAPIPASIPGPPSFRSASQPVFAGPVVRYAGEIVGVVLAESPYAAADAAEAVVVDYTPGRAVAGIQAALKPEAPRVFDSWPDNAAGVSAAVVGDVDAGFAQAQVVVETGLALPRVSGVPLEPRAILAVPAGPDGKFTVWTSSQSPYGLRAAIAGALGLSEEELRVVVADTGGGFGIKGHTYPEDIIVPAAARRLGRPVKWIETRRENFLTASPDRGQEHTARLGLDREGRITALETTFAREHGGYLPLGEVIARNTINHLPGPYRVPSLKATGTNVVTHTVFSGAYRGSGRPEAAFVMERLLDRAARRLGLDPAEIRRRNLIRPEEMPFGTGLVYRDGTPVVYDPADYPAAFEKLLAAFDYEGWRRRQAERRGGAHPIGIGLANCVHGSGVGPFEGADVRVDGTGAVHVLIAVSSQGQAHETTMAQIAAAELGVEPERVRVMAGDTALLPYGMGTGGSRVAANSGPAVARSAREVAAKARLMAAELLECAPEDVVLAEGRAHVAGVPGRAVSLGQLSKAALRSQTLARSGQPGLQACAYFAPESVTFGFGAHACALEVDVETGQVRLLRYVTAHDPGRAINPMVVEGQIHGGVAQGLGTALWEELVWDGEGQLLTGSLMDYVVPKADELPALETVLLSHASTRNDLGIKGIGESGIIPGPAVIANAVEDALADRGVEVSRVPVTPPRLWQALYAPRVR